MTNQEKLRELGKRLLLNVAAQALPNWAQMGLDFARDFHELFIAAQPEDRAALVEAAQGLSEQDRAALIQEIAGGQGEIAERVTAGMLETLRINPLPAQAASTINQTMLGGTGQTLRPRPLSDQQRVVGAAVLSSMMVRPALALRVTPHELNNRLCDPLLQG